MELTRINHFEAKPGRSAQLRQFLHGATDHIRGAHGCRSVEVLQGVDRPEMIAVIETWDSLEARRAAQKAFTAEQLEQAMRLLVSLPTASSFRSVNGA